MRKYTQLVRPVNLLWLALSLLILGFDQYTKNLASTLLTYGQSNPILPVLDFTLVHNFGAAFSFLADQGGWQRWFFTALSAIASVCFALWILIQPAYTKVLTLALALVLGGALGNLVDRSIHGYVVDFIAVHWQHHYFPVFNIADTAISIGAFLLFVDVFFLESKRKTNQAGN